MGNKIEAVIFDWAGTTVDFGCFAPVNVFIDIFKERGIDVTIEEARAPMGMLKIDHIREMTKMSRINNAWIDLFGRRPNEDDVKSLYESFKPSLMNSLKDYTDPIEQAVETTEWLRKNGIKIGSTTGYTSEMMEVVCEEAKSKGYYPDCLVTSDDTGNLGRPYPFMIFKNMQKLKVQNISNVIKIGDTTTDIKEGKNAGCYSVGVVIGSSEMGLSYDQFNNLSDSDKKDHISRVKNSFYKCGADFVIDSLSSVPDLIQRIQNS